MLSSSGSLCSWPRLLCISIRCSRIAAHFLKAHSMPFNSFIAATLVLTSLSFLPINAHAQATMDHSAMGHSAAPAPAKAAVTAMTEAEVKKVDRKAETITLQHGLIKNLEMPAMTMVFKVKTPALLAKVKVGDKVKFNAEMPDGVLMVTALELSR